MLFAMPSTILDNYNLSEDWFKTLTVRTFLCESDSLIVISELQKLKPNQISLSNISCRWLLLLEICLICLNNTFFWDIFIELELLFFSPSNLKFQRGYISLLLLLFREDYQYALKIAPIDCILKCMGWQRGSILCFLQRRSWFINKGQDMQNLQNFAKLDKSC